MYLTQGDYATYHYAEIADADFDRIEARAADVIDAITDNFYQVRNLESDMNSFRTKQFKKAVAKEIEYMLLTQLTGTADVQNKPASQSIGSTSISVSSQNSSSGNSGRLSAVIADEVYSILAKTGLLYRGVDYVL
ncbi:hypothetical protein ACFQ4L_10430 [Lapidilactobacillus mulanensis]|uniref:Uncharacterized protein n=1 Tax=Lapidilactobacillus mulanensis TaxID=2485999 RepID=A0ABW4DPB8_9LACO|nr:hypothetical protein [Lapidilactobacillus mulanensis]